MSDLFDLAAIPLTSFYSHKKTTLGIYKCTSKTTCPWEYTNSLPTFFRLFCLFAIFLLPMFLKAYSVLWWPLIKNWACLRDRKPQDVHVHFVGQTKSGKVRGGRPNFHNISSVETRETISSIHCRMKEYISKICLWNTMIKQNTD